MDGTEVGVFEQADEVGLGSLLQGGHSTALEPDVGDVVARDFADEALERQFSDEEFGGALEFPDLAESDSARTEVGFLGVDFLAGEARADDLGGYDFSWGFASGRFARCLFCSSHEER